MFNLIKFHRLFTAIFTAGFALLLYPLPVHPWGIGEKDIKAIRNDIAILYEKLNSFEKSVNENIEVILRNQATANAEIPNIRDDLQKNLGKLDDLNQYMVQELKKNAHILAEIQGKFDNYASQAAASAGELKQESIEIKETLITGLTEQKESNETYSTAMEEKLNNLIELLKTIIETGNANNEKLLAQYKGTGDKIADIVNFNKKTIEALMKKPDKQVEKVHSEIKQVNKKILTLVGILKSSIVENASSMKQYNSSVVKLMKSIDEQLSTLSGQPVKKK